jgi:hypothetical protein
LNESSAIEDLAAGRKFYDRQEAGVGDYFFDSLFAEIDSLAILKNAQCKTCPFYFFDWGSAVKMLTD